MRRLRLADVRKNGLWGKLHLRVALARHEQLLLAALPPPLVYRVLRPLRRLTREHADNGIDRIGLVLLYLELELHITRLTVSGENARHI